MILTESSDITQRLFVPQIVNDPTSSLAPIEFSLHTTDWYRRIPLLLPTTRFLDISIDFKDLVGFADIGLSRMSALECLVLNVSVTSPFFEWSAEMSEERGKVLNRAAENYPNLRYIRINVDAPGISRAYLSGSWEILREQRHGSHFSAVFPIFKPLDAQTNKSLQPQSIWTKEEKKD